MIKRPDDDTRKVSVSEQPVTKKKPELKVPMNNAVSQGVKDVLTDKAGMNVIDKKKMEKTHFLVMGAGVAFMAVALIISSIVGSSRSKKLGAVEAEIGRYKNQIAVQETAGSAQSKSETERNSVGLNNETLAHDSQLIGETLDSMLNWQFDGMQKVYSNIQGIYHLPDDSTVTDTFYKGSYAASQFDHEMGMTVYCTNPVSHLRKYACEVTWKVTLDTGITETKSALFTCCVSSVNDNGKVHDVLSELEAYEVSNDDDVDEFNGISDEDASDHSSDGMSEGLTDDGMVIESLDDDVEGSVDGDLSEDGQTQDISQLEGSDL